MKGAPSSSGAFRRNKGVMKRGMVAAGSLFGGMTLEEGFANPPQANKPVVWWWFHNASPEETITLDLEAMKRAGLGGFHFRRFPKDPVKFKFALGESARLGPGNVAEVFDGEKSVGIAWTAPYRVEITGARDLSIRVTNQWPNRLIYDSSLPAEKRLTRTNINPYKPKSKLMRSGLFGPVRILEEKEK